jgi:hypothetical protein
VRQKNNGVFALPSQAYVEKTVDVEAFRAWFNSDLSAFIASLDPFTESSLLEECDVPDHSMRRRLQRTSIDDIDAMNVGEKEGQYQQGGGGGGREYQHQQSQRLKTPRMSQLYTPHLQPQQQQQQQQQQAPRIGSVRGPLGSSAREVTSHAL